MKPILLTHLAFNLTALNNNEPCVVLSATNEPKSFYDFETALYGPEGNDDPDYEAIVIEIPEHVAKLLSSHQAVAAYLIAKVGEIVGEDIPYSVEIFVNPETRRYELAITPPEAAGYVVDQEEVPEGETARIYPTFGSALSAAHFLKTQETHNWIEISPVDAQGSGEMFGGYVYYDAVEVAG